jgi:hypothetical protein
MSWQPPKQSWKIRDSEGQVVLESTDPQAVVDKAHDLDPTGEKDYSIDGDPYALGVLQERDRWGNLLRGPKEHRRPSQLKSRPQQQTPLAIGEVGDEQYPGLVTRVRNALGK